ncbi:MULTISPECIES: hypothetical protein [Pseudoalteromonas]|uniref:hypothetical protein n=1 Tax=Pseudoalteromonas TaxID=53246 RepID=UPI000579C13B|nr:MULTISPECIES: hypothetical protein [Pseudoalteromonas]ATG59001.1 hypothetical protein CPA52_12525 [Pseudoalteromonas marina]
MLRIFAVTCVLTALTGCSGVTYHTNINNDVLGDEIGTYVNKRDLHQFYSDQQAHESGASLLGRIEGESCHGDGRGENNNVSYNRAKSSAIDSLKADAMRKGGNAFTINSCRETPQSYCDISVTCTGQAYDLK